MRTFMIQVLIAILITIKNNDCRPESSQYYDDYYDSNETDQSSDPEVFLRENEINLSETSKEAEKIITTTSTEVKTLPETKTTESIRLFSSNEDLIFLATTPTTIIFTTLEITSESTTTPTITTSKTTTTSTTSSPIITSFLIINYTTIESKNTTIESQTLEKEVCLTEINNESMVANENKTTSPIIIPKKLRNNLNLYSNRINTELKFNSSVLDKTKNLRNKQNKTLININNFTNYTNNNGFQANVTKDTKTSSTTTPITIIITSSVGLPTTQTTNLTLNSTETIVTKYIPMITTDNSLKTNSKTFDSQKNKITTPETKTFSKLIEAKAMTRNELIRTIKTLETTLEPTPTQTNNTPTTSVIITSFPKINSSSTTPTIESEILENCLSIAPIQINAQKSITNKIRNNSQTSNQTTEPISSSITTSTQLTNAYTTPTINSEPKTKTERTITIFTTSSTTTTKTTFFSTTFGTVEPKTKTENFMSDSSRLSTTSSSLQTMEKYNETTSTTTSSSLPKSTTSSFSAIYTTTITVKTIEKLISYKTNSKADIPTTASITKPTTMITKCITTTTIRDQTKSDNKILITNKDPEPIELSFDSTWNAFKNFVYNNFNFFG